MHWFPSNCVFLPGRGEEHLISLEYIQRLHDLHEEWLVQGNNQLQVPQVGCSWSFYFKPMMQVIVVDANKGVEEMEEEFRRQEEHILGQNKENSEKPVMGKRLAEEASVSTKRLMEEEAGNPTRQKLRLLGQEF